MRKLMIALATGGALSAMAAVAPASAAIVDLGPAPPIASTITGIGTLNYSPTADIVRQVTDPEFSALFPNQNPNTTIPAGIETLFSLPAGSLSLVLNDDGPIPNPYDPTIPSAFNFAAIHNDTGELVFFYTSGVGSFHLDGTYDTLSNARFYSCVPGTPGCSRAPPLVPEPGTLALLGSALAGLGWLRRRRRA